jgi:hypothetical protein
MTDCRTTMAQINELARIHRDLFAAPRSLDERAKAQMQLVRFHLENPTVLANVISIARDHYRRQQS